MLKIKTRQTKAIEGMEPAVDKASKWFLVLLAAGSLIIPIAIVYACSQCGGDDANGSACAGYLTRCLGHLSTPIYLSLFLAPVLFLLALARSFAVNPVLTIFHPPEISTPFFHRL